MIINRPFQLLHRVTMGVASRFRNIYYRALGVRMDGYVWMRSVQIPRQWEDITLEKCALDHGVVLLCSGERCLNKIVIRSGTYINRYTIIDAHLSVEVGRDVMMGPFCFITDADHGMARGELVGRQQVTALPVTIGDGAWLGANVIILKGVKIGPGAIVGGGSVVTHDVAQDEIVAGIPARSIGTRSYPTRA